MDSPQRIVERLIAQGRLPDLIVPPGKDYWVFGSPSQRENSKHSDHDALGPFAAYADSLPGVEGGENGVGYWADGKEESRLVHVAAPEHVLPVAVALRHRFNQKATIGFVEDSGGPDKAHVLHVAESDPDKVHTDMMRHGVEYKTVVPHKGGATVYVLDSGGDLEAAVNAYARESRAHLDTLPGRVHFVGGDKRPGTYKQHLSRADVRAHVAGHAAEYDRVPTTPEGDGQWRGSSAHDALLDFLDEHDDPRADLVRPDVRGNIGNPAVFNEAHTATGSVGSVRPSVHTFPDGTDLIVDHYRGPRGVRHVVNWDHGPHTLLPMYRKVFDSDAALMEWVDRFPAGEREKMRENIVPPR